MNIRQVLGYTCIAGTPVVTGLYTVLLPFVTFALFGSSRHLVVAADSATERKGLRPRQEIVAAFSTADDVAPTVKSALIKALHTALGTHPGKQGAQPA